MELQLALNYIIQFQQLRKLKKMSKINPVIIDYGVGNIFSLKNAIEFNGHKPFLTNDLELIDNASHIFLPGVGSFEKAIDELKNKNLFDFLKKCKNKKIMGICLGMQLLFEKSFEMGEHLGLGLLKGVIDKIEFTDKNSLLNNKVPNIGWHETKINENFKSDPIFLTIKFLTITLFIPIMQNL